MADTFDPYHKWLGIPPREQPANYYRLLGIELYEGDATVIESAADRQMTHVRKFQAGPHSSQTQKLLNELSTAKLSLLHPDKKAAYDGALTARLAPPPAAPIPIPLSPIPYAPQPLPLAPAPLPLAGAAGYGQPGDQGTGGDGGFAVETQASSPAVRRFRQQRRNQQTAALGMAAMLLAIGGGLIWHYGFREDGAGDQPSAALPVKSGQPARPPLASGSNHTDVPAPGSNGTELGAPVRRPKPPGAGTRPATPSRETTRIDLLKLVQPADAVEGQWRLEQGALVGSGEGWPKLEIPHEPVPEHYTLALLAERTQGESFLGIGLVCGGRQVLAVLDMQGVCGLHAVSGLGIGDNGTTRSDQPRFEAGKKRAIICTVRPGKIQVACDGQPVIEWQGDPKVLVPGPRWDVPHSGRLYLGVWASTYRISKLELMPLTPAAETDLATSEPSTEDDPPPRTLGDLLRPATRLDPPEAAALVTAQRVIQGSFPEELERAKNPTEQAALARRFLERELFNFDDPAEQFVLLEKAAELASESGQYDLADEVLSELGKRYVVDVLPRKSAALGLAAKAASGPADFHNVAECWVQLVNQAVAADDFEAALDFSAKAETAARKSNDKVFVKQIVDGQADLKLVQAAHIAALPARESLDSDSPDEAASAAWGRFLCAYKNDWEHGLPIWAGGGELGHSLLARRDLAGPKQPAEQVRLGDAWWQAAEQEEDELVQRFLKARAALWYGRALGKLAAGEKQRVQERLDEQERETSPFVAGQWVELLPMVDLARHSQRGTWGHKNEEISVTQPAQYARFTLPVAPSGSYDFSVQFTLMAGDEADVILPVAGRDVLLVLGGWRGTVSGLNTVDGRAAQDNSTTVKGKLPRGQKLKLEVEVRVEGSEASVEAKLANRRLISWKGKPASLANAREWWLPQREALGLGAFDSSVIFHSARLRIVDGSAKRLEE